jgi:hypothetical protein
VSIHKFYFPQNKPAFIFQNKECRLKITSGKNYSTTLLDEVEVTLRPTVSRPASLGVIHLFGAHDQTFTYIYIYIYIYKTNSSDLVLEQTIPTEQPPLVGEVSANFCGYRGVAWSVQRIPYGRNLAFLDYIYAWQLLVS